MKKLKVVFISDTHGQHEEINLPKGDIFIHGGDICKIGDIKEVIEFNEWLKTLDFKYLIIVPGNHDSPFQNYPNKCNEILDSVIVASEGLIQFPNGLKISVYSWTPEFGLWSFMLPRGSDELYNKVQKIQKCDILVSHGPAYGVLDKTTERISAGCKFLLKKVKELQPKYLLSGHIHEAKGASKIDDTLCLNGSQVNEKYQLVNEPIVFEIEVE